ncbi:S-layer family protein [Caldicellulosiruptor bescii]|uniref:S-layer domain protein n=2 Tax=Caldicellulosiruptor bescii TaxID=31899 RepID=B9MPH2_CALBD|nr:S-layer homology domain-containing protein [Caldicellulosiruptor bescii]ACM59733.1 S-layer domain protein [Caldicellulosiruptor bescii DSM 6725]PBC87142.1 S-layer family protein [Caldicellulosiruptor bescii]PBC90081.1 S-layer family protein [Caldicellulosiruptor bescii]PBD04488.1 S-layer family protein [Caldicellulosiruptor bescii]PBD05878.1 S-layer family protein [Caldicellulosiruptor bescii]
MKKRTRIASSLLLVFVFLFSLLSVGYSAQEVILNSIPDKNPGEDVVISGQTMFDEIVIKVLRPNSTILYINTVKGKNFSDKFTLPADLPEGTYTVVTGKGSIVDIKTFNVVRKQPSLPNSFPEILIPNFKEAEKQAGVQPSQKEDIKQTDKAALPEITIDNSGIIRPKIYQLSEGRLDVRLDESLVQKALQMQVSKNKILTLDLKNSKPLVQYNIVLPSKVFTASFDVQEVLVDTDELDLKLPADLLKEKNIDKNKQIEILIKKVENSNIPSEIRAAVGKRPIYEIGFYQDLKKVNVERPTNSIKISIAYTPGIEELSGIENLVLFHIKEDGKTEILSNSKYVRTSKCVIANVNGFSKFAIGYVTKKFDDLKNYSWAEKAVSSLAARNIISGVDKSSFRPQEYIKRGEFVKWLVNALGLDAQYSSNFEDVKKDSSYWREVAIAKALGIAKGYANKFKPEDYITRQDMMVLVKRALEVANKPIVKTKSSLATKFSDSSDISLYAQDSISILVANDLIKGNSKNQILPRKFATRAEAAQLLFRIFFKWE